MLPARVNTEELAQIVWMTTPAHAQLELQGNLAKSVSEYVCLKGLRLGLDFYSLLSSSPSSSSIFFFFFSNSSSCSRSSSFSFYNYYYY